MWSVLQSGADVSPWHLLCLWKTDGIRACPGACLIHGPRGDSVALCLPILDQLPLGCRRLTGLNCFNPLSRTKTWIRHFSLKLRITLTCFVGRQWAISLLVPGLVSNICLIHSCQGAAEQGHRVFRNCYKKVVLFSTTQISSAESLKSELKGHVFISKWWNQPIVFGFRKWWRIISGPVCACRWHLTATLTQRSSSQITWCEQQTSKWTDYLHSAVSKLLLFWGHANKGASLSVFRWMAKVTCCPEWGRNSDTHRPGLSRSRKEKPFQTFFHCQLSLPSHF